MNRSSRALAACLTLVAAPFLGCDSTPDPVTGEKPPIKDVIKKDVQIAEDKAKELAGKAGQGIKEAGRAAGEKLKEGEAALGKGMQKAGAALEKHATTPPPEVKAPEIKAPETKAPAPPK
jgi:hypothetical protein